MSEEEKLFQEYYPAVVKEVIRKGMYVGSNSDARAQSIAKEGKLIAMAMVRETRKIKEELG